MKPAVLLNSFIMVLSNPQTKNNQDSVCIKEKILKSFLNLREYKCAAEECERTEALNRST